MKERQKHLLVSRACVCVCLMFVLLLSLQVGTVKAKSAGSGARKKVTVRLYDASGRKVYWKATVKKGEKVCLPGMRNGNGRTVLGWSEKKGSRKNPQYQVGQRITVRKSMKLYPVIFSRAKEPNLSKKNISKWYSAAVGSKGQFSRIVFVGDSRTVGMQNTLQREFGSSLTGNVYFIAAIGARLGWLQQAESQIMRLAGKNTAIVFNHGVNDLKRRNDYIPYMKKLGRKLKKQGCTLFYLSINPLNSLEIAARGGGRRTESNVIKFNRLIRSELCENGPYHYLDSYTYLIRKGYGTENTSQREDGLHYSAKTYKRIYQFCMREISQYE